VRQPAKRSAVCIPYVCTTYVSHFVATYEKRKAGEYFTACVHENVKQNLCVFNSLHRPSTTGYRYQI
jgi:hypothetical protein